MSASHKVLVQVLASILSAAPSVSLAWPAGGVAVAPIPGPGGQLETHLLLGRDGSVLSFWSDGRWFEGTADTYGQLLTRYGQVAPGWPDTGLMIMRAPESQRPVAGLSLADGSFIVAVEDSRNEAPGVGADQYISHVLPDGRIDPTWPRHGFRVTDRVGPDRPAHVCWLAPDTLLTMSPYYNEASARVDLLYQSVAVTAAGPVALWGSGGLLYRWRPNDIDASLTLAPDGAGGVFTILDEIVDQTEPFPVNYFDTDLFVMRLGRDGLPAAGWEAGARPLMIALGFQQAAAVVEDGEGGLYVAWADARGGAGLGWPDYKAYEDIRLLRVTSEGAPWAGWPAQGLVVTDAPAWQYFPTLVRDGAGGVYVAWDDHDRATIGLTRVRGDGTFAPGWGKDGIAVSTVYAYASYSHLVLDGIGGVFVLFEDVGMDELYLQHVLPNGMVDPGWPATGELVSHSGDGAIVADGSGGCYVAFLKVYAPPIGRTLVHVARYDMDGPVPVRLAETSFEAEAGRVSLVWHGAEATAGEAQVQRRPEAADVWTTLGSPRAVGRDELAFEDLTVEPGSRYAYRLTRGAELLSGEQWVEVPRAAEFALAGAWPNPGLSRELSVAFTLAGGGVATLEVLDLAGRREHARSLAGLPPGRHTLGLADAGLAPGMHWLRLREGSREAHARFVVVR